MKNKTNVFDAIEEGIKKLIGGSDESLESEESDISDCFTLKDWK